MPAPSTPIIITRDVFMLIVSFGFAVNNIIHVFLLAGQEEDGDFLPDLCGKNGISFICSQKYDILISSKMRRPHNMHNMIFDIKHLGKLSAE